MSRTFSSSPITPFSYWWKSNPVSMKWFLTTILGRQQYDYPRSIGKTSGNWHSIFSHKLFTPLPWFFEKTFHNTSTTLARKKMRGSRIPLSGVGPPNNHSPQPRFATLSFTCQGDSGRKEESLNDIWIEWVNLTIWIKFAEPNLVGGFNPSEEY